ncbi:MAG: hypothetical protein ACI4L9_03645 [Candidatus Coproplasma sp.]
MGGNAGGDGEAAESAANGENLDQAKKPATHTNSPSAQDGSQRPNMMAEAMLRHERASNRIHNKTGATRYR